VAGEHELVVTGPSPAAFLDAELQDHPLAASGFEVLRRAGRAREARESLLRVLDEQNQDHDGFRGINRYVIFHARSI
jgi:hypothetical protein